MALERSNVWSLLRFPERGRGPIRSIVVRVAIALGAVVVVTLIVYLDRDGYRDGDGKVDSVLDALYYATVSLSTTGYGDITPVSPQARLTNVLLVTPLRLLFLIVLVGTTIEVLTRRTTQAIRASFWRRRMRNHVIIVGFGVKGESALRALIDQGRPMSDMVVVDRSSENVNSAVRMGAVGVQGDSTREPILVQAGIDKADTIIVCVDRDDTAVLVTLTARRLARKATIVTSVRESQNVEVLKQSGANVVIPTAESAGRMLGLSSTAPRAGEMLEDLLGAGEGLELRERLVLPEEIGHTCQEVVLGGQIAIGVVRDGQTLRWDNPEIGPLRRDDGLVVIHNCDRD